MAGNYVRVGVGVKDEVSGPLDRIKGKFETLGKGSGFKALAMGVGLGAGQAAFNLLGDAASATADFIGDSIQAASDMNETLSKSSVVFGSASSDVEAFGDTAAKAFGLSKQEAIEAAASLGNVFTGVGQTKAKAAEMSTTLVKLAGDLASFNNIDPTDALDKLRAGLSGESEPLRRVGVFLTEAKVKAKALEMGLGDAHGELTEGEKIMARYALIMKETATAQGDFARTSDGLANSQRTANAELKDLQAQLGTSFEPIALEVTKAQLAVVDFVRHGVEGWQMLGAATEKLAHQHRDAAGNIVDDTVDIKAGFTDMKADVREDLRTVGVHMGYASEAAEHMADKMDTATGDAADYYHRLHDAFISDTEEMIDDAFDPLEEKLDVTAQHFEILAAITTREEAKSKAAVAEANRAIIEDLDDQAKKLVKLGDRHKLTAKEVDQYEKDVKASYAAIGKKVPPEIQKVINKLRILASYDGKNIDIKVNIAERVGVQGHVPGKANAMGGPGYGQTLVGEYGPEIVDLPAGSNVHTAQESAAMLGASKQENHYHLTVLGDIKARDGDELFAAMRRLEMVALPVGWHFNG